MVKRTALEPTKREYKNITAIIRTINVETEKVEAELVKNIDGPDRRDWLKETVFKASIWAMFNGCYVEVINKEDDKE